MFLLIKFLYFDISFLYEFRVFTLAKDNFYIFMARLEATVDVVFGVDGFGDRNLLIIVIVESIEDKRTSNNRSLL